MSRVKLGLSSQEFFTATPRELWAMFAVVEADEQAKRELWAREQAAFHNAHKFNRPQGGAWLATDFGATDPFDLPENAGLRSAAAKLDHVMKTAGTLDESKIPKHFRRGAVQDAKLKEKPKRWKRGK